MAQSSPPTPLARAITVALPCHRASADIGRLPNRLAGIPRACLKTGTTHDEHTAWHTKTKISKLGCGAQRGHIVRASSGTPSRVVRRQREEAP
jgi:hypothetical protein